MVEKTTNLSSYITTDSENRPTCQCYIDSEILFTFFLYLISATHSEAEIKWKRRQKQFAASKAKTNTRNKLNKDK